MHIAFWAAVGAFLSFMHAAGLLSAAHAVIYVRTSQGAVAWGMALVLFPYAAVPLYWIFGSRNYRGYLEARRGAKLPPSVLDQVRRQHHPELFSRLPAERADFQRVCEKLADFPFTRGNGMRLLVNGQESFDAIFGEIEKAERYILLEYFIVRDDGLGRDLKQRLLRKAAQGVKIYFIYDQVGSHGLNPEYPAELARAGVKIFAFRSTLGGVNRFQLNFRNHRKITVVDGRTAFVGGHNVGDEYLGKNPKLGHWRDTHVQITGPAVFGVQMAFLEDYHWVAREVPDWHWIPDHAGAGRCDTLPLSSGPISERESCTLFFLEAINSARRRLWLTSPYFVPDEAVVNALELAALRGVDVRVLLPCKPDHIFVYFASFAYLGEILGAGIRVFRYQPGFLHQKVMVIDDDLTSIGTANLDNRSFRLNFEISIITSNPEFSGQVAAMLERDFAESREIGMDEFAGRNIAFKALVKASRLLSPVL